MLLGDDVSLAGVLVSTGPEVLVVLIGTVVVVEGGALVGVTVGTGQGYLSPRTFTDPGKYWLHRFDGTKR